MPQIMLVNAVNEEESRIAIVSDGRLEELSVETAAREQIEGNIYKAKIVKVLPSLDAVFVDYGGSRNGFLAFPDIHPKYFAESGRGAEGLRKGQDLLVQVRKGEIGQKGAALTTYVSIPGRYIVLMPLVSKRGVSRKIQDDEARKELKDLLKDAGVPEDMGYIVRTAGFEQTKQDLSRDVSYLIRLWKKIQAQYEAAKGPALLYQESDIVIRTLRDYFTPSIQEVWVDDPEIYEQVRAFFRTVMPWYQKRLRLHEDKAPLFARYDLEAQLASIHEKTVPLPAGGSIVIEQTEALVSVDVNSGKTMKGKDIEETAFIANREAADEVARQLRLRDLGGLIVIDFIDMKSSARRTEVRKVLQKALKEDKARTDVGSISKFGLLELSRQRIKPAGLTAATTCVACGGTGRVRSAESVALTALRLVQQRLAKRPGANAQVLLGLPPEPATILLNRKRKALAELEADFGISIAVFSETALPPSGYYIEFRKDGTSRTETNLPDDYPRGQLRTPAGLPTPTTRAARPSAYTLLSEIDEEPPREVPEEPADETASEVGAPAAAPAAEESPGGNKKKRRRRKRKKKGGAEPTQETAAETPAEAETEGEAELEVEAKAKVRDAARRRPSKQAARHPEPSPPGREEPVATTTAVPAPSGPESESSSKKLSPSAKRRLRRRRKKALETSPAASAASHAEEEQAQPVTEPAPAPASTPEPTGETPRAVEPPTKPRPARKRRGKSTAEAPTAVQAPEALPAPPEPAEADPTKVPKAKRPSRPRRRAGPKAGGNAQNPPGQ